MFERECTDLHPFGSVYQFKVLSRERMVDNLIVVPIPEEAFIEFDKKIPGFIDKGILVGPETRSSSPVRIKRNDNFESINTKNLYPMGEGAGYGGGIVSCALDGLKISDYIINSIK